LMKDQPPVDGIVFLYESKNTQSVKEFFVEEDDSVSSEVLGRAADVSFAVIRGVPPRCPEGKDGCSLCAPYYQEVQRQNSGSSGRRAVISGGRPV
jgi:hypothetical protein